MARRGVVETLRMLAPMDPAGADKLRIGGAGDGGYVLLDRLNPRQTVMSFGVGPQISFDLDMAQRGHDVLLFDHTVDALPAQHARCIWYREGIAAHSSPDARLFTLADHMAKLPVDAVDPILKMDVEGAEWSALAATPPVLLARFAQITVELHHLLRLDDASFNTVARAALGALAVNFALIHVHANNFGAMGFVGGLPMADTLEVTFIRRDIVPLHPSQSVFPTALDTPNFADRPDHALWFFPFLPGSADLNLPTSEEPAHVPAPMGGILPMPFPSEDL